MRTLEEVSMVLGLSVNKENGVPLSYSLIKPRTARIQRTVQCVCQGSWGAIHGTQPGAFFLSAPLFPGPASKR